MSMKCAFSALLSALLLLSGCVFPQKLSDRNRSALSAYAIYLESGEGGIWLRYEGEISGEALDGLWEIIETAETGEPISGGICGFFRCGYLTNKRCGCIIIV